AIGNELGHSRLEQAADVTARRQVLEPRTRQRGRRVGRGGRLGLCVQSRCRRHEQGEQNDPPRVVGLERQVVVLVIERPSYPIRVRGSYLFSLVFLPSGLHWKVFRGRFFFNAGAAPVMVL